QRRRQLVFANAVVDVPERVLQHLFGLDAIDTVTGLTDHALQAAAIQRSRRTITEVDRNAVPGLRFRPDFGLLRSALLRALFAVQHVGARDLVLAGAHQRQLDVILNVLDVHRTTAGQAPRHVFHHLLGDRLDGFANAAGSRALLALDVDIGLGDGQLDLGGIERRHL